MRLHHLTPPDRFQEKFQYLHMAGGFVEIFTPRVQSMAPDQEAMKVCIFSQQERGLRRERLHVLAVFKDRQPLTVLVRADAVQTFEHFVAFDEESTPSHVIIREDRAPDRVCMQDCACPAANYGEMEKSLGRGLALSGLQHVTCRVHFKDLIRREAALIYGAGGDCQVERFAVDDRAKVSTRSQSPSAPVKLPSKIREAFRGRLISHDAELYR